MKLFPALIVILLITSCKNNNRQPANETLPSGKDSITSQDSTTSYVPFLDLIRQDLSQVDSFAGGILKKTTYKGKTDSLFIKPAEFHQAAAAFLLPELETASFSQSFTESSIMDETTGQIQFIYTPNNPSQALRNVVAYISPAVSANQVNRIYLDKQSVAGDTLIQQKLTWKIRQYFYIITIRQPKQGPAITTIEKVIWDPEHFGD
jgi:hypothetical protein